MQIAILTITDQGMVTAGKIEAALPGSERVKASQGIKKCLEEIWHEYDGIICVMAAGIVVRCIAALCRNKFDDPAIVVVDEQCRYAISLLSGHIGGANKIALQLEKHCGVQAVITTGSDVSGHTALDLWAMERGLGIVDPQYLAAAATRLLNRGVLSVYQDYRYIKDFPDDFKTVTDKKDADIIISVKNYRGLKGLRLVPRVLYIGFGCRRGADVEEFQEAIDDLVRHHNIQLEAIAGVASIDLKNNEEGLLKIADTYNWPASFFTKEQINAVCPAVEASKIYKKVGVYGVCEPAAVLAASRGTEPGQLIIGKLKWQRITAAVAARASSML
jgi:cobalt-precorrin 5A hydrolase